MKHIIYLALGSNVGNRKRNIDKAIMLLSQKVSDIEKSALYETKAVGYTMQNNFLNMVLKAQTDLTPENLLQFTQQVEHEAGRIYRFHWGPREIDIDILFYDDSIIQLPNHIIPHPRLHERDFVLQPLTDIEKDHIHPVFHKTIQELLHALPANSHSLLSIHKHIL